MTSQPSQRDERGCCGFFQFNHAPRPHPLPSLTTRAKIELGLAYMRKTGGTMSQQEETIREEVEVGAAIDVPEEIEERVKDPKRKVEGEDELEEQET